MAVLMLWVRPRGIRGILMLVTTLVSFGISMYTLYFERKEGNEHNKLRKDTYDNYLREKRDELARLKIEERKSRNHNFIDFRQIIKELDHTTSRLFERDIRDEWNF